MTENIDRDLKAAHDALTLAIYRRDAKEITEAVDVLINIKTMIACAEWAEAMADRVEQALGARP